MPFPPLYAGTSARDGPVAPHIRTSLRKKAPNVTRSYHRSRMNAVLQAEFPTDTAANWMRQLNQADVPPGPVCARDQVLADGQVQHLDLSVPLQHLWMGELHLAGMPIQMLGVTSRRREKAA